MQQSNNSSDNQNESKTPPLTFQMRNRSRNSQDSQLSWIKFVFLPLELSIINSMCSLRYPVLPTLLSRKAICWKGWTLKNELSTLNPILCTPPKKPHQFLETLDTTSVTTAPVLSPVFLKYFQCTTNAWVMFDFFCSVPRNSHSAI